MGDAAVYDLAAVVAERDALTQKLKASEAEVARLTDVLLSKHGGEPLTLMDELDEARAEVALRKSEVELFRDKLKARCDEVAKLKAACAAKDAALRAATTLVRDCIPSGPDLHNACAALEAALSDDAGKNYVDASGAVEAEASRHVVLGNTWLKDGGMLLPGDWAGALVKIVRVKP